MAVVAKLADEIGPHPVGSAAGAIAVGCSTYAGAAVNPGGGAAPY